VFISRVHPLLRHYLTFFSQFVVSSPSLLIKTPQTKEKHQKKTNKKQPKQEKKPQVDDKGEIK